MQHWMALLPASRHDAEDGASHPAPTLDAQHLGWWALQFTPRVAQLEEAVVLEYRASERLFGGARTLRARLSDGAQRQGAAAWAFAPHALAALCLARHRLNAGPVAAKDATPDAVTQALDALPFSTLSALRPHAGTLARLGCRTLGDVRALPRGGVSRRFDAATLRALDQAYGLSPLPLSWLTLPEVFDERLELPGRVESAMALLHGARVLLHRLCAWLAGQHAGVESFTLRWHHGLRRHQAHSGQHTVRLSSPSRDVERLAALLSEHLHHVTLEAPVEELSLRAEQIAPLVAHSHSLFPEQGGEQLTAQPDSLLTPTAQRAQREALWTLLDRLGARLGAERVQTGQLYADHRLEHAQRWQAALPTSPGAQPPSVAQHPALPPWPQPSWVLEAPMPLTMVADAQGLREHPHYQGRLHRLAGPHRVEAGWWDAASPDSACARDYYLASSPGAGLLWVFRARHTGNTSAPAWFLHGLFT